MSLVLLSSTLSYTVDAPPRCLVQIQDIRVSADNVTTFVTVSEEGRVSTGFPVKKRLMSEADEEKRNFLTYVVNEYNIPGYANAAIRAYIEGVKEALSVTIVTDV